MMNTRMISGDFESLKLSNENKVILGDAYKTITDLNLWDWLKRPDVPGKHGFMLSDHKEFQQISDAMKFNDHSGSSFAYVMRTMELIAKYGWEAYVKSVTPPRYRISFVNRNGYSGHGEPIYDSYESAKRSIVYLQKESAEMRWGIYYFVERVSA